MEEEEWGLSDYRLIWGTYKARVDRDVVRKVVDKERLKGITKGLEEGGVKEDHKWYEELRGESNYDKLMNLRAQCLKDSWQEKWARRW